MLTDFADHNEHTETIISQHSTLCLRKNAPILKRYGSKL